MVVEQLFDIEILCVFKLTGRFMVALKNQIEPALTQFREFEPRVVVHQRDLKAHPRRSTGQFIDNRRQHAGGKRFRATDPDLSRRRISQKFDVSDPLPEFVEGDLTATDQGLPVKRRLDAAWAAVEKPHADRTLQVGYGLPDGLPPSSCCPPERRR